ncbi:hypothetical protein BJ742DRAFT_341274 [Cladochytrium replicatum]|nr:hypothetical protein BJ742DRAFT_341274 [Cladochytrium replicatum]
MLSPPDLPIKHSIALHPTIGLPTHMANQKSSSDRQTSDAEKNFENIANPLHDLETRHRRDPLEADEDADGDGEVDADADGEVDTDPERDEHEPNDQASSLPSQAHPEAAGDSVSLHSLSLPRSSAAADIPFSTPSPTISTGPSAPLRRPSLLSNANANALQEGPQSGGDSTGGPNSAVNTPPTTSSDQPDQLPVLPYIVPRVYQCAKCHVIFGDSYAQLDINDEAFMMTLTAVTAYVQQVDDLQVCKDGPYRNGAYKTLQCGSCGANVGCRFVATQAAFDHIRECYSFHMASIMSYRLGPADSRIYTDPMQWRSVDAGGNSESAMAEVRFGEGEEVRLVAGSTPIGSNTPQDINGMIKYSVRGTDAGDGVYVVEGIEGTRRDSIQPQQGELAGNAEASSPSQLTSQAKGDGRNAIAAGVKRRRGAASGDGLPGASPDVGEEEVSGQALSGGRRKRRRSRGLGQDSLMGSPQPASVSENGKIKEKKEEIVQDKKVVVAKRSGSGWKCSWCCIQGGATPTKRRGPDGPKTLCNACGLAYSKKGSLPADRYEMFLKTKSGAGGLATPTSGNTTAVHSAAGSKRVSPVTSPKGKHHSNRSHFNKDDDDEEDGGEVDADGDTDSQVSDGGWDGSGVVAGTGATTATGSVSSAVSSRAGSPPQPANSALRRQAAVTNAMMKAKDSEEAGTVDAAAEAAAFMLHQWRRGIVDGGISDEKREAADAMQHLSQAHASGRVHAVQVPTMTQQQLQHAQMQQQQAAQLYGTYPQLAQQQQVDNRAQQYNQQVRLQQQMQPQQQQPRPLNVSIGITSAQGPMSAASPLQNMHPGLPEAPNPGMMITTSGTDSDAVAAAAAMVLNGGLRHPQAQMLEPTPAGQMYAPAGQQAYSNLILNNLGGQSTTTDPTTAAANYLFDAYGAALQEQRRRSTVEGLEMQPHPQNPHTIQVMYDPAPASPMRAASNIGPQGQYIMEDVGLGLGTSGFGFGMLGSTSGMMDPRAAAMRSQQQQQQQQQQSQQMPGGGQANNGGQY